MIKVLITGANGLVGQHIAFNLLKFSQIELLCTAVGDCRINSLKNYYSSLDVTKAKSVASVFASFKPDIVINCAAKSQVDDCEQNLTSCHQVNVLAVKNIIQNLPKNSKLIHLSSDFVFDGKSLNYTETDITNPLSSYGKSKREAELLIQSSKINYQIIRTILVFGFGINLSRNNILTWVVNELSNNKNIYVVQDQKRMPTYVSDLANAIIELMFTEESGIFHISGNEVKSVYQFAQKIAEVFQLNQALIHPILSETLNQPGKRPPKTGFNLNKIENTIKFSPTPMVKALIQSKNELNRN